MDNIDIERLKTDLQNDLMGAFVGGGFGGAFIEAIDVNDMSDDDVLEIAQKQGIDLSSYIV